MALFKNNRRIGSHQMFRVKVGDIIQFVKVYSGYRIENGFKLGLACNRPMERSYHNNLSIARWWLIVG